MAQGDLPIVATTLNNPLAILSISFSISCSADCGEFRIEYEVVAAGMGAGEGGGADGGPVGCGGGRSEYSEDDGAMNDRYWSIT